MTRAPASVAAARTWPAYARTRAPQIRDGSFLSSSGPELLGERRIFENDGITVRTAGGAEGACRAQHNEEGFHFGTDVVHIHAVSKRRRLRRKSDSTKISRFVRMD